jgi:hypothetical protein
LHRRIASLDPAAPEFPRGEMLEVQKGNWERFVLRLPHHLKKAQAEE